MNENIEKVKWFNDVAYELVAIGTSWSIVEDYVNNLPLTKLHVIIEKQKNQRYAVYIESVLNYY